MSKSLYVGNLPYTTNDDELKELFAQYGEVLRARVITDRYTGQSRGFGFVDMESAEAEAALEALNSAEFGGRNLKVDVAQPREPRPPRDNY